MTDKKFHKDLAGLPKHIQDKAREQFGRWMKDQRIGDFKELQARPGWWRVQIGDRYRAMGYELKGQPVRTIVWTWIGSHEDYNKRY